MDLNEASEANLQYILKEIGTQLGVVNSSLLEADDYDLSKYDELKMLYDLLQQKKHLSVSETQAFIEELAKTRK